MAGRPHEPVRWTIERAAAEFGIDRRTLTKRLRQESIEPGEDGFYSTANIVTAAYGDLIGEKTLLTKVQRKREQLKLAKERGEIIESEIIRKSWESIIVPAKQKMLNVPHKMESRLGLSEQQRKQLEAEIDDILGDLGKEPDYNEPERAEESAFADT